MDKVKVLDVHNDDTVEYYTVQFIDGREKQTIKEYLTLREDRLLELKKIFQTKLIQRQK